MRQIMLCLLTALCVFSVHADDTNEWSYFKATSGFDGAWNIDKGTAIVDIKGNNIVITVYKTAPSSNSKETGNPVTWAAETITGTLDSSGNIYARDVIQYSDANPVVINGRFIHQTTNENWGGKIVPIAYSRIVLSNNYIVIGLSLKTIPNKS